MSRPGLDPDSIIAIQALDALIKEMRENIEYPSAPVDEDSAVKLYLLYLSILIDVVLADIVMSALAKNDLMVEIKQRILLEYSAKGIYLHEHPSYALYMLTVAEAWAIERKLEKAQASPQTIAQAKAHHADMRSKFPPPAGMVEQSFENIFREYAGADDYVWLYGIQSAMLHGDPEGMRAVIELQPGGSRVARIENTLGLVNAMLVDTGRNALVFADRFLDRFRPGEEPFISRVRELQRTFLKLVIKHRDGRDDDDVEEAKILLRDFDL
jgi:hypothetical protein